MKFRKHYAKFRQAHDTLNNEILHPNYSLRVGNKHEQSYIRLFITYQIVEPEPPNFGRSRSRMQLRH
jgi:hypothetical protein